MHYWFFNKDYYYYYYYYYLNKVRVVFDGSAQQNGKSLNSESLPVLSCKVTLWMFKLSLKGSLLP